MKHMRLLLLVVLVGLVVSFAPTITLANPPTRPSFDVFLTNCNASYFNNLTLSGTPALTRTDASINFVWAEGTSPGPGVNVDNYSVGWLCPLNIPTEGDYTVTVITDDGMNLLLDGTLFLWAWYDQGPTTYTTTGHLTAGAHALSIQYYNRTLGGTAQVSMNLPGAAPVTYPDWKGEYFNNQTLSGSPALTRNDTSVNFDWGLGSPDPTVAADHFSARWTRTLYFGAGTWRFTTTTDDGVRLWVDGTLLIDQWHDQSATTWSNTIYLGAANHTVTMEYFDNSWYAVAKLSYAPYVSPTQAWFGQYFNNTSFSGSPVFTRSDDVIDFNWGEGSPGGGMPSDNFAVKWDATKTFTSGGNFTLKVTSDDGVRVWVDGVLVIDAWYDHPPTTFSYARYYSVGNHTFHVEYYEHGGGAQIKVEIVAAGVLGGDIIVDDRGLGWQAGGCYYCWYNSAAGYGGHSFWTFNNTFVVYGYNWARWYVNLPQTRFYEVYAYIPAGLGNTTNARYWIAHAGTFHLAPRNQGLYPNQWVSLGTYWFNAGYGQYVSLSDVTGECYLCRTIVFDAVKFSPR